MADELQFYGDTGLTVTARVYDSTGTQVGTDAACTEVGVTGIYQGDMPTTGAGIYGVRFIESGAVIADGSIVWNGAIEVTLLALRNDLQLVIAESI